ncbi:DUF3152 domain-containing protein [Streptomyces sp. NBC_00878]|uniref:DUF3152 domain-containing protein n=1 Tax=Streptomyces sp. NBC_00878 TaxID=2975854 RepID=UPI00225678D9|nr:DUF3152 domain-containing protein [Streptomyces sp. NBC_00878]MCX4905622.1 DUF3152 domain-containing protein [Streptomyces sp. NBC_00878]
MGRHSRRRGSAPKRDTADIPVVPAARPEPEPEPQTRKRAGRRQGPAGQQPSPPPMGGTPSRGVPRLPDGWTPRGPEALPGQGVQRPGGGMPPGGAPGGASGFAGGAPAGGPQRFSAGPPTGGVPRLPDGTPAHGFPRLPDGTPAHGTPRYPDGTPAHGVPRVRGGHPEQRETGGSWGELRGGPPGTGVGYGVPRASPQGPPYGPGPGPRPGPGQGQGQGPGQGQGQGVPQGRLGPTVPRQRQAPPPAGARGARQAYLDAFDEVDDPFAPRSAASAALRADPYAFGTSATAWDDEVEHRTRPGDQEPPESRPEKARGGKGRAFTGIAAAAVITVLAVVVAAQAINGRDDNSARPQTASDADEGVKDSASRTDGRPVPSASAGAGEGVATLSYAQQMATKYPLAADLKGSGQFAAVSGFDKAPGSGRKYTYRVDVEKGLGLDGGLFAKAVQKTLNDDRSWAHDGDRTFERVSSGKSDFVITLASPGTTAFWCAKSGLDTKEDNVSCDSAATERVMINAYRWAQGAETYGDKMYPYRQMLINHEVGHRLGFGHVSCSVDGGLAPVMQQQTKFLDHDGIRCRPNPWAFPGS